MNRQAILDKIEHVKGMIDDVTLTKQGIKKIYKVGFPDGYNPKDLKGFHEYRIQILRNILQMSDEEIDEKVASLKSKMHGEGAIHCIECFYNAVEYELLEIGKGNIQDKGTTEDRK